MCGRYTVSANKEKLAKRFQVSIPEAYKPRYNAAPTQALPVITNTQPDELQYLFWGLIPQWAKNKSISQKLINARAETLDEKASFKQSLRQRRCLIPADGFYEWKRVGKRQKTPYRFALASGEPFAFAGLWESFEEDGKTVGTFTIVTTEPNEMVRDIHDRMPVILRREDEQLWLSTNQLPEDLLPILQPYTTEAMTRYTVSIRVNKPDNDTPDLIQAAPASDQFGNYTLFN
ncbi:MAG TPA: DUF159 family protein [Cytophagales bacterium]|nr:DUF159 family protein [Cytophagales bacterium]HAA17635.1 DUF159 family protein [Cytophagales bacterium]HAP63949.1 DUF159 family protein [Cytophagales bacterium]